MTAIQPTAIPATAPRRLSPTVAIDSRSLGESTPEQEQLSLSEAAELELYGPGDFDSRDNVETSSKSVKLFSTLGSSFKALGTKAGLVGAVVAIPDDAMKAGSLIEQARTTGEVGDINRAVGGVTYAAGTTAKGAKAGLDTAVLVAKMGERRSASKAAVRAFRQASPTANKKVANAAGRAAATQAVAKAKPNQVAQSAFKAAESATKGNPKAATGAVSRKAATRVLRKGGTAAGKAAVGSIARGTAVKTAGKIAGRFVPGLNIGIAALDTATFVSTLADPKASWAKKGIRGLTAGASIIAASNIPFLSQGAAIISAGSSVADAFIKR